MEICRPLAEISSQRNLKLSVPANPFPFNLTRELSRPLVPSHIPTPLRFSASAPTLKLVGFFLLIPHMRFCTSPNVKKAGPSTGSSELRRFTRSLASQSPLTLRQFKEKSGPRRLSPNPPLIEDHVP